MSPLLPPAVGDCDRCKGDKERVVGARGGEVGGLHVGSSAQGQLLHVSDDVVTEVSVPVEGAPVCMQQPSAEEVPALC